MNKYLTFIFIFFFSTLITGCASGPLKPNYIFVHDSCDWVRPIYLTDHDIDVLDKQTKRDILAHNKAWQANCQRGKNERTGEQNSR